MRFINQLPLVGCAWWPDWSNLGRKYEYRTWWESETMSAQRWDNFSDENDERNFWDRRSFYDQSRYCLPHWNHLYVRGDHWWLEKFFVKLVPFFWIGSKTFKRKGNNRWRNFAPHNLFGKVPFPRDLQRLHQKVKVYDTRDRKLVVLKLAQVHANNNNHARIHS